MLNFVFNPEWIHDGHHAAAGRQVCGVGANQSRLPSQTGVSREQTEGSILVVTHTSIA